VPGKEGSTRPTSRSGRGSTIYQRVRGRLTATSTRGRRVRHPAARC
jgi:hypothetical protein